MVQSVLIVDDDIDDIELLVEAVNVVSPGIDCISFTDPLEAVDYLKKTLTIPEVVIIDLHMPKMNGAECLEAVLKTPGVQNARIVLQSSSRPTDKRLKRYTDLGAEFFEKPVSFQSLCQVLAAFITTT